MNNNLQKIIQEKIKEKEPTPRYVFLLKNGFFWATGMVATVVGALSVAVSIFIFVNHGKSFLVAAGVSRLSLFASVAPYIWIIVFLVFLIVAEMGVRRTDKGYRYSFVVLVSVHLLASFVFGLVLYFLGVGYVVEKITDKHFPRYQTVLEQKILFENSAEDGLLVGIVNEHLEDGRVVVMTPGGKEWQVYMLVEHEPSQRALDDFRMVRVIGYSVDEDTFGACRVSPFFLRGGPKEFPVPGGGFGKNKKDILFKVERKKDFLRTIKCGSAGLHYEDTLINQ